MRFSAFGFCILVSAFLSLHSSCLTALMAQFQVMCGQQDRAAELGPRMLMLCPDYMIVQGCASWGWSGG